MVLVQVVDLHVVEVGRLLPDVVVAVEITPLEKMRGGSVTMTVGIAAIDPAAQMIGQSATQKIININLPPKRDREMKDERDDVRENGTNGEDRKGKRQEQRELYYLN